MSGRRDESLLLDDMISSCGRLIELGAYLPDGSDPSIEVAEGILWNLTVLGEAAKGVSADVRERFSEIEWSQIARTRDFIVHHYEGVDWSVIAQTIEGRIPALLERLMAVREQLQS